MTVNFLKSKWLDTILNADLVYPGLSLTLNFLVCFLIITFQQSLKFLSAQMYEHALLRTWPIVRALWAKKVIIKGF